MTLSPDSTSRRAQMADLARMAGVSTSTVSRALSGSPLIPAVTRDRITELARSLNYQINVGAANLRKRAVQSVGVVVLGDSMQAISDPFILSMIGSVADALDAQGSSVLLARLSDGRWEQMQAMVSSRQVSGLVVIGQLTWHQHLNRMAVGGTHLAVWGANLPDAAYPLVGGDNEHGGYLAAAHLLARGCKRIAFFGDISHPESGLRHAGYVRAHREAGLEPDDRLRVPVLFGESRLRAVVDDWLDHGLPFDGVFANNDMAAIVLISALKARGVEVPRDVKVVGYDDIEMASHVHPSLTSVRQPTQLAGQSLVALLSESQQNLPRRSLVLPTELIARESSC
ncbi:MAG: LacI family DNA-binding transcriptional regulator [Rhodoferax sp.]|jgi:DNA-binding LacI/PurR family transcriptional regulator|uniref:LacI family DNA-binding transcriptional regulator n=1 Tax=Rhodoferax sp. TaxID=50421 RepID=UPI001B498692|nr:LacI family DNA-binding transcriptional regulator [Rhodoferax sp.]MBP9147187.1 LacI family DNA-binding transcriptional regulator [Rhodoferax sp.]MBP9734173.1 LacI family DNA-binding transcriptional regulator [Rhodoferax sp.]